MNYFAHGLRFLDRPWFAAGTAVPDWLSAIDRPVRVRARDAQPFADGSGTPLAEMAAGILQHLDDDGWFHATRAFSEVSHQLTRAFKVLLEHDDSPRAPFLGHIATEILLDGILIRNNPALIDEYYQQLSVLDPAVVQQAVNTMARRSTERLQPFLPRFFDERFLYDYDDSRTLWRRLNQVLHRVKLDPLPPAAPALLDDCRAVVDHRRFDLLPGFERWL